MSPYCSAIGFLDRGQRAVTTDLAGFSSLISRQGRSEHAHQDLHDLLAAFRVGTQVEQHPLQLRPRWSLCQLQQASQQQHSLLLNLKGTRQSERAALTSGIAGPSMVGKRGEGGLLRRANGLIQVSLPLPADSAGG